MSFNNEDNIFEDGGTQYLSAPRVGSRRAFTKQGVKGRKSSASLRGGSSLVQALDEDTGHGMHSLAHELAFALMPEPSAGSKMLQEEFGIEYDEGAEGIDGSTIDNGEGATLALELNGQSIDIDDTLVPNSPLQEDKPLDDLTAHFGSIGSTTRPETKSQTPQVQDPMDILSKDLESTDKFLSQLRQLDTDAGPSSAQLTIEKIASDMIRHINESVRDREAQVRELVEVDREFRKMAGEMNGTDILGQLDSLEVVDGLMDRTASTDNARHAEKGLDSVREESRERLRDISNDWETNPDDHQFGDEDVFDTEPLSPSPIKDSFPQPPPLNGPPTVLKVIPQVVHVRALTTSLATSLTTISEHAQVNGAANADAGRKIRALKNKLGSWKSDWESAERSRIKIERWEAGLPDNDNTSVLSSPPRPGSTKRIDGRRFVEEHLRAFENVLAEANRKTQAIMARS